MSAIGSLCSGYGGLDLAVEEVFDARTVWYAEIDPAASRVLATYWPGIPNLGDLTTTDWATVQPVDILTAGYPCQPDSLAGKGLSEDDHRWIWPDIARAVSVLRPRNVVLENVPGHFVRGFRTVLGSLTALGYDTQWTLVRASDVGAPHRRERLFVVATDATDIGHERGWDAWERRPGFADSGAAAPDTAGDGRDEGRPESARLIGGPDAAQRSDPTPAYVQWGKYEPAIRRWERHIGRPAPAPTELAPKGGQRLAPPFVEWLMGLPAGWVTDVPGLTRNDALRCLGNGVVPQQAVAALRELTADLVAA